MIRSDPSFPSVTEDDSSAPDVIFLLLHICFHQKKPTETKNSCVHFRSSNCSPFIFATMEAVSQQNGS